MGSEHKSHVGRAFRCSIDLNSGLTALQLASLINGLLIFSAGARDRRPRGRGRRRRRCDQSAVSLPVRPQPSTRSEPTRRSAAERHRGGAHGLVAAGCDHDHRRWSRSDLELNPLELEQAGLNHQQLIQRARAALAAIGIRKSTLQLEHGVR